MTAAAVLAMHGLPALRFLRTEDPEERLIYMALAKRATQLRELEQRSLAAHIVNALGKAMRRG